MRTDDSNETGSQCAETIRRLAEDAFAQHEVSEMGKGEWMCKRPGSGFHHFFVISRPGMLLVYGDIGEWVLRMSNGNPVEWAAQAVRSPGYFFEKVRACDEGEHKVFYPAELRAWLREQDDGQKALDALRERECEYDFLSHEMAMEVLHELGWDDVWSIGVGPGARSYWLLEAMRWFTARLHSSKTGREG